MQAVDRPFAKIYETYWAKIEAPFRGSERTFDSFVRDYLALLTKPKWTCHDFVPPLALVYATFSFETDGAFQAQS